VCSRNRRATVDVFIDGRSGSIGQRSRGGVAGEAWCRGVVDDDRAVRRSRPGPAIW